MLILTLILALQAELPPADLAALLKEAEQNNPDIAAALSRRAETESTPPQLEALPDPIAGVSYTNSGLTRSTLGEDAGTMLSLSWSQEVPYPGKRRLAGDTGRREIEVMQRRIEQVRLDVATRVKQAFAELYHADRSAQILSESRELLTSFLQSARARYESGEGLLQNVLKAQTEITKLDAEMEKLVEERRVASALLNTLAGRPADTPLGPALSLPETVASPDPAAIEARAIERAPEILEQEAAIRREQARLELARLMVKPDFIWGAAYGYRGGLDPEVSGSFGMRLPLFRQRKQAQAIAQTTHEVETAKRELESRKLKVAAEVRRWLAQVARAESLERLYREGVIPQARSALESSAAAFGVGRVDFLTLLSDFGTVLAYEMEYVTQHHERVIALASLERLVDEELVRAGSPREEVEP